MRICSSKFQKIHNIKLFKAISQVLILSIKIRNTQNQVTNKVFRARKYNSSQGDGITYSNQEDGMKVFKSYLLQLK